MKKLVAIFVLVGLMSTGAVNAAVTLTFDELPMQSVNGLSYNGITFGFRVSGHSSTDAVYNGIGPENLVYLDDPTLEGTTAGLLTLDFDEPVDLLKFGVALNSYCTETPAYAVRLYDSSHTLIDTFMESTCPLLRWSEGRFTYSGAKFSRAVIGFNEQAASRFALDNLTFDSTNSANSIPAPGAVLLSSIGLGLVNWLRRRKTL